MPGRPAPPRRRHGEVVGPPPAGGQTLRSTWAVWSRKSAAGPMYSSARPPLPDEALDVLRAGGQRSAVWLPRIPPRVPPSRDVAAGACSYRGVIGGSVAPRLPVARALAGSASPGTASVHAEEGTGPGRRNRPRARGESHQPNGDGRVHPAVARIRRSRRWRQVRVTPRWVRQAQHAPAAPADEHRAARGVTMDTPQEGRDEAKVGSADAKVRAAAVIGAWACIGLPPSSLR
jgi:hypothetical protein